MATNKLFGIMALLLVALTGIASAQSWNNDVWINGQPYYGTGGWNSGNTNQPGNTGNTGSAGAALPISISEVEVDGTVLTSGQTNKLSIQRDQDFKVKVTFTANADHENIMGYAFISGYEYDDTDPVSDTIGNFDVEASTTYTKTFTVHLPKNLDSDNYQLRIMFADRNGDEMINDYSLKIDEKRHSIEIKDVILYPENSVTAGSALMSTVRVKNFGQKDEDDVKVTVSIPALGLEASDYIDSIDQNEQEDTEEIYMRIPRDTKAGDYEMLVTVSFNDGHDSAESSKVIHVDSDDAYVASTTPQSMITLGSTLENVQQGQSVLYPITVTNSGNTDVAYSVAVAGASDWADVTISPTTTQIIKAGESKAFYLSINVNDEAALGSHVFTATISAGSDQVQQVAMTANVTEAQSSVWAMIGKVLGIALVALVIVLVILGIIMGYNRMNDKAEPQTYY